MTTAELEEFIYDQIPSARALGARILRADTELAEVRAPLISNHNHFGTAFGGSLNWVLVLACYTWFFAMLKRQGYDCHVLIASSQIRYLNPVSQDFTAICLAPPAREIERAVKSVARGRPGRLTLAASIDELCEFEGIFVAKPV